MNWILLGWAVLATLVAVYLGRQTYRWAAVAEGFKQAALYNKEAAEALEYEAAVLRSAVFTVPAEGEGELDIRA